MATIYPASFTTQGGFGMPVPAAATLINQALPGNESWLLAATVIGLLGGPAVSHFYQADSAKALKLSFSVTAVAVLLWGLIGFSEVWGAAGNSGVIGQATYGTINVITGAESVNFTKVVFELVFALLTLELISGAVGHIFKTEYFIIYTAGALLINYCAQAYWFWNAQGWMKTYGVVDNAGGAVVHITAGVASLVLGLLAGGRERHSYYGEDLIAVVFFLAASLAQNAGKASFVVYTAPATGPLLLSKAGLALVNTQLAFAAGIAAYNFLELTITKQLTLLPGVFTLHGTAKGAMIGLACVASGAATVSPVWTILNAVIAVVFVYFAEAALTRLHLGVGKTVFLTHGLGGAVGVALTGIFSDATYSSTAVGAFYRNAQLLGQACAGISVIILMTAVTTALLFIVLQMVARTILNDNILTVDEAAKPAASAASAAI